jgi:hypothetical protein
MFGLISSIHDGGRWLQRKVITASLPATRCEDGNALAAMRYEADYAARDIFRV